MVSLPRLLKSALDQSAISTIRKGGGSRAVKFKVWEKPGRLAATLVANLADIRAVTLSIVARFNAG